MTVTDIASKFKASPLDLAALAAQVERADAEVNRIARNPNDILTCLLAAGCIVAFSADEDGTEARVTMPDYSVVKGAGPAPMHALVNAYGEGAWLADFPAVLARAASE